MYKALLLFFGLCFTVCCKAETEIVTDTTTVLDLEGTIGKYHCHINLQCADSAGKTLAEGLIARDTGNILKLKGYLYKDRIWLNEYTRADENTYDGNDDIIRRRTGFIALQKDRSGQWTGRYLPSAKAAIHDSDMISDLKEVFSCKGIATTEVQTLENSNKKSDMRIVWEQSIGSLKIIDMKGEGTYFNFPEFAAKPDPGDNYAVDQPDPDDEAYIDERGVPFESERTVSIQYADKHFLSVHYFSDEFDGGSHGQHDNSFRNFDVKTGRELSYKNLFLPGTDSTLLVKTGKKYFKDQYDIDPDSSIQSTGLFDGSPKFYLPYNFFMGPKEITFYYQTYEIAPYMAGDPQFTIPYAALKDIIDPKGPLGWVLKEP